MTSSCPGDLQSQCLNSHTTPPFPSPALASYCTFNDRDCTSLPGGEQDSEGMLDMSHFGVRPGRDRSNFAATFSLTSCPALSSPLAPPTIPCLQPPGIPHFLPALPVTSSVLTRLQHSCVSIVPCPALSASFQFSAIHHPTHSPAHTSYPNHSCSTAYVLTSLNSLWDRAWPAAPQ